jgi:hypothetical protein
MEKWEVNATKARKITKESPIRKLEQTKREICEEILLRAQNGESETVLFTNRFDVAMLEDWCNIYNWLLKLGYEIEDETLNGIMIIKW